MPVWACFVMFSAPPLVGHVPPHPSNMFYMLGTSSTSRPPSNTPVWACSMCLVPLPPIHSCPSPTTPAEHENKPRWVCFCVWHLSHPTSPLKHVEHARLGVFDVFGAPPTYMRHAEHVKHAQTGVFDVFSMSCIQPSPLNTSNTSILMCLTCLVSTPPFSSCSLSPPCHSQPLPSFSLPFPF